MIIRKNNSTYFISPERSKSVKYVFEDLPKGDPALRTLLVETFMLYSFQKLDILEDLHMKMEERDPALYGCLALLFVSKSFDEENSQLYKLYNTFALKNLKTTQHRQIFMAHLLTASNKILRETGLKLIDNCPVNEISEVLNYSKKIFNMLPRSMRTAIKRYIKKLESDPDSFDRLLLGNKNTLKHIYASLHIKPSERAEQILFKNRPPEHSIAEAAKILNSSMDAQEILETIEKFHIPYFTAVKNIKFFTYAIAEQLVERLNQDELLECLPLLKTKGVLRNEDLYLSIREKLKDRIQTPEAMYKKPVANRLQYSIDSLRDEAVKTLNEMKAENLRVKKKIALFVDRSGSLYDYREVAKGFIYIIGNLADPSTFSLYLFDKSSSKMDPYNNRQWFSDFDNFNIDSGGSCFSAPLKQMIAEKEQVELICIVSDGNENSYPSFTETYTHYVEELHTAPYVILVKIGYQSSNFEKNIIKGENSVLVTEFKNYRDTLKDIWPFLGSISVSKIIRPEICG